MTIETVLERAMHLKKLKLF